MCSQCQLLTKCLRRVLPLKIKGLAVETAYTLQKTYNLHQHRRENLKSRSFSAQVSSNKDLRYILARETRDAELLLTTCTCNQNYGG